MINTEIRNKVVHDYFNTELSVNQISEKYNISVRSVYGWTHSERNKRRDRNKAYTFKLSKKELEVLQCSLFNYKDSSFYPDSVAIAQNLRTRILDKLETINEIEKANK